MHIPPGDSVTRALRACCIASWHGRRGSSTMVIRVKSLNESHVWEDGSVSKSTCMQAWEPEFKTIELTRGNLGAAVCTYSPCASTERWEAESEEEACWPACLVLAAITNERLCQTRWTPRTEVALWPQHATPPHKSAHFHPSTKWQLGDLHLASMLIAGSSVMHLDGWHVCVCLEYLYWL